jgi:hypothetical protein
LSISKNKKPKLLAWALSLSALTSGYLVFPFKARTPAATILVELVVVERQEANANMMFFREKMNLMWLL